MLRRWISAALLAVLPALPGGCAGHGGGCDCCGGHGSHADSRPAAGTLYRCPHDGATRDTPGPCPKCGMALGESHRVTGR